jgi:hypothetical protein
MRRFASTLPARGDVLADSKPDQRKAPVELALILFGRRLPRLAEIVIQIELHGAMLLG